MRVSGTSLNSILVKITLLVTMAVGFTGIAQAELPEGASPEEITDSALAASVRGDWTALAATIDSAEVVRIYQTLKPAVSQLMKDSAAALTEITGEEVNGATLDSLDQRDPKELLIKMIEVSHYPQMGNSSLIGYDIIGSVYEGDSLCYVVSHRNEMTVVSMASQAETNTIGVTSLRKTVHGWRLLPDDKIERAVALYGKLFSGELIDVLRQSMEAMQNMINVADSE